MTIAQAKLEVEAEGFALTTVNNDLPWQHVLILHSPLAADACRVYPEWCRLAAPETPGCD